MKLGTRGSALAMTQSTWVADQLRALGHEVELVAVKTLGDVTRGSLTRLPELGAFAAQLRTALLHKEVDFAVHSLKDLPVEPVPGLVIAAIPKRELAHDALCARDGLTLSQLPHGARIGTGSPRRVAQLRALRPDLSFVDIRGNIDTRLSRVSSGDLDAVVLAAAGLRRLGLQARITELLPLLSAPGQGALAVECRADDDHAMAVLRQLDHSQTRLAVTEERRVLAGLGGGCAAPIAAVAHEELIAGVFSLDGAHQVQVRVPLAPGAGESAVVRLLAQGADEVTELKASRTSRLAEFHDDAELWPTSRGRSVFLPREAGKLSEALTSRGLEVTAVPVQRRRTLTYGGQPAADWSVITSARTVEALNELGVRLTGQVAAVGRATAAALRTAGYDVALIPALESARGLLSEFPAGSGKVFLPCSALAPKALAEGLRGLGWQVEVAHVYTMEPETIATELVQRWQEGRFAAVVVTSGSVARVINEALGWPVTTRVLAIGQPTQQVLNELGVAASVSSSPHAEDVADAVADLVGKGNS